MKTKNILICGLVGTVICGGTYALDTSDIKAKCEQSDKTVWVDATKVCVPKNPCKNDKYSAYCDKEFSNTKFVDAEQAGLFVRMYMLYSKGIDVSRNDVYMLEKPGLLGQDYMYSKINGNYIVFEIDSLNADKLSGVSWGEQVGYCDESRHWIKKKNNFLPYYCTYYTDYPSVIIKKDDVILGSIGNVASVFNNMAPATYTGRYQEGTPLYDDDTVYYELSDFGGGF